MKLIEKYKGYKICKFTKGDDLGIYRNIKDALIIITPFKEEIINPIFTVDEAKEFINEIESEG